MKQNNIQKPQVETPNHNEDTQEEIIENETNQLEEFLKIHFKFPSDNIKDIVEFICEDDEMQRIIYDLPTFLLKELQPINVSLDFMKETDPNEKILEIVVYSNIESEILLQKENYICDILIDKYPENNLEYIILVEKY